MSTAPHFDIDMAAFWSDPYPTLAQLRKDAPIAFVPQLGGTVFAARADIFLCEKNIEVFSSHQPQGLMNRLMGQNMMRKDGDAHMAERKAIFPSVSPKTVKAHWTAQFQAHADRILDALDPGQGVDFCADFAMPFSAECLKSITGLTNMRYQDMDAWSQAMIDGIANYTGEPAIEERCHRATAGIDAAIDDRLPVVGKTPDQSLLSVMLQAGMPMESVRANIKLAISGGQNEPRDAIAGTVWALLTHPERTRAGADRERCRGCRRSRNMPAGFRRSACRRAGSPSRMRCATSPSRSMTGFSFCTDRPIATSNISNGPISSMSGATPRRALPSAPARISVPGPGRRVR